MFGTLFLLYTWVISDWGEGWLGMRIIPGMESELKGSLEMAAGGTWLAQLVKRPPLGFGNCHTFPVLSAFFIDFCLGFILYSGQVYSYF